MNKKLQEKFDKLILEFKKNNKIKENKIAAEDLYELFLEDENELFFEYLSIKGYQIKYKNETKDLYSYSDNSLRTYLEEISSFDELSPEEEKYYFSIYKKNPTEELKSFLIERNLKLVISVANCFKANSMEILDLIQAGNIGLMLAIDKFDITKGYKFSTYARPWIWKYITLTIANDSRTIRIPRQVHDKTVKLNSVKRQLMRISGEEPSVSLLSEHTGYSEDEIKELLSFEDATISLYTPSNISGTETNETLQDLVPDKKHLPLEDKVIGNIYVEQFWKIAKEDLTEREYELLSSRYDNKFNTIMSLPELGREMNVSHQAVGQIEQRIKRKCRENIRLSYYR